VYVICVIYRFNWLFLLIYNAVIESGELKINNNINICSMETKCDGETIKYGMMTRVYVKWR